MSRSFFTGNDTEMYTGSAAFSAKITADPTDYGLVAAQATAYAALNSDYAEAYLAATDPETRTKGKVAARKTAKAALKVMAADLAKIIDGTPAVTDEMKIDLGLNVRKHPSPIPPPTDRPGMDLVSVVARMVTIHIHDSASSIKRGKPAGAIGANVYTFVGATYPTDPTEWEFDGATTKATHEIVFPDTVPNGQQVWICAAWFNRRLETGPVSEPITTNIQGGLSMAA